MPHTSSDREVIQDLIVGVTHDIDAKRWSALRARFADQVTVDYTSLFGGTAQQQAGDALVGGWTAALAKVSTQHLLGPIEVNDDDVRATAGCHVRAWHLGQGLPGGDEWVVAGHYRFTLVKSTAGWKIDSMTLETLQQTGNRKLLEQAAMLR